MMKIQNLYVTVDGEWADRSFISLQVGVFTAYKKGFFCGGKSMRRGVKSILTLNFHESYLICVLDFVLIKKVKKIFYFGKLIASNSKIVSLL